MGSKITLAGVGNNPWGERHILQVKGWNAPQEVKGLNGEPDAKTRDEIEPWLTALFQSEHLSLLVGTGLSYAVHGLVPQKDARIDLMRECALTSSDVYKDLLEKAARESAETAGRGEPNIEDRIRVANDFIRGMEMYVTGGANVPAELGRELCKLKKELRDKLGAFAGKLLKMERDIVLQSSTGDGWGSPSGYLANFLMCFSGRPITKDRLNIFTTNYDRLIEYGAELAGIRLLDRFVGTVNPVFRSSRVEVDMHYDPPGIRGEPRHLEGVVRFTKLHGSLDWVMRNSVVRRVALPYGVECAEKYREDEDTLMIYPNEGKDRETAEYPYVELFRDFAASVCRPNTTLVVYGYSFGDSHINRVIRDMLTIPSTHLVIISYEDSSGRIQGFCEGLQRDGRISLLVGKHLAGLKPLVDNYLPKPFVDRATIKMAEVQRARGLNSAEQNSGGQS